MKELVFKLLTGVAHNAAALAAGNNIDMQESMLFACGGNELEASFMILFLEWPNDLQGLAHHYGYEIINNVVETIPPAPSLKHSWDVENRVWVYDEEHEVDLPYDS